MNFSIQHPNPSYVQLCLYKTALSTCELLVTGRAFLFPNIYRQFMDYLADGSIDLVGVCVSKSRLLTFLLSELLLCPRSHSL